VALFQPQVKFPFHVMLKPAGPVCNLNCDYCYYLSKKSLYPQEKNFRMTESLLEQFTRQYIEAHPGPYLLFGWQGGEPTHSETLSGLHLLQEYNIEYNILCVVNNVNVKYPLEVYNFFKKME